MQSSKNSKNSKEDKIKKDSSWNAYPRPQLVRDKWVCLNGKWTFNRDEKILVPFCPESKLSGICRRIEPGELLVYERKFMIPDDWKGMRTILHFGAVDQKTSVYINNKIAGTHEGGYLPFSFDITDFLIEGKNNKIKVEVVDDLDHKYPWGKQKRENGGMWYTPVSGIWQTVWIEAVPQTYIESLKIDVGLSWVEIRAYGIDAGTITLLGEKHKLIKETETESLCASIHIDIRKPQLWTPEDPHLYEFTIESGDDKIKSYFALRTLSIKETGGYQRLCLNEEPYFFNGVLDQGYWEEGIYTPPEPECFERDILAMKSLGFNTLRKHIKIEPEQFYYDCDRLGMVVFQDMVNNSDYSFVRDSVIPIIGIKSLSDKNRHTNPESRRIFLESMEGTVKHLYNHQSICYWTIFNEGWGQFCADKVYDRLRTLDVTRFIDSTSGWFRQKKSDVDSHHIYFMPVNLTAGNKPLVLSEFGGYACRLIDHCFNKEKIYGYKKFENEAALLEGMGKLYDEQILPLIDKGLCAAIYTQLSDVEDETNGLLTYDRKVQKFKAYIGTGRIEIIGNHTDHQGGRVLVAPTEQKIRAYVADNYRDIIRIVSKGFEPFEVSLNGENCHEKGTSAALVEGIIAGFTELYGKIEGDKKGFDVHIKSEIYVGSGLSSSAAFEVLIARIINDRYYDSKADPVQIAKISMLAETEYYGKPCGMQDQLAISLGRMALLDFSSREPEFEFIDFDFDAVGLEMKIINTDSSHDNMDEEFASIPGDMYKVAELMGINKLGDINIDRFYKNLPILEKKVEDGEITELQLNRAKHFYDENERVLAGAVALQAGRVERFLACVNESGLSSEKLLKNILPEGVKENPLSLTLKEYKNRPEALALKLEGGGFGGSILVFENKHVK